MRNNLLSPAFTQKPDVTELGRGVNMAITHCMKLETLKGQIKNKEYYTCGIIAYKSQPQRHYAPIIPVCGVVRWDMKIGGYSQLLASWSCLIPE